MGGAGPDRDDEIRALAAAWLARIRADNVRPADRTGFQTWLDEDERHREAFTAVAAMWETTGSLDRHGDFHAKARPRRTALAARGAAVAAMLVLALTGAIFFARPEAPPATHVTGIGEQLRIPLPDGSTAMLDTGTTLRVAFSRSARVVELIQGRAFLDVAHDPAHPFIVRAGSREVIALGTSFNVEHSGQAMQVVLINGRVVVHQSDGARLAPDVELRMPGEFANLSASGEMRRGQANLERETAWQIGKIVFDDEPLSSAVAQMNRYSLRPIVLADESVGALRISGIYNIGNVDAFATSVSVLWPVEVTYQGEQVVLAPKTQGNGRSGANSSLSRLR
jgi:transmembrane sensor